MIVDILEGFSQPRFLTDYWQKKPCLINNWLRPQPLPLTELLGLAEAHELPTRLVSGSQQRSDWRLQQGPLAIEDLPAGQTDWTILVQEMDKASPAVASLLDQFRFLPDWAIDDIMISDAVDGGSVGPHVDAYDVFLVQAGGRRRWQLAENFDPATDERFELKLLKSWQPETEIIVGPGQALYLPAGIAHHGTAIDHCQTWSVGLRTPSGPELMFALAEALAMEGTEGRRMSLSGLDGEMPSRLNTDQIADIRGLLAEAIALDDTTLSQLSAAYLSRWRLWQADSEPLESDQVLQWLRDGVSVPLAPTARLALADGDDGHALFVNGEAVACTSKMAEALASERRLGPDWAEVPEAVEQLCDVDALTMPERIND